jgi:glycogen synthase
MSRRSFSVVIVTYNRANLLGAALASLRSQRHPQFEVIVVNGPSSDNTEDVLSEYRDLIKIERCPEANAAMARNIGIAASAGEIIGFLDDDATAEPNWLCELEPAYVDPKVSAAGGFTRDYTGYDFQWKYMIAYLFANSRSFDTPMDAGLRGHRTDTGILYPSGVNSSFLRRAVLEVGGFDEYYCHYAEDLDLVARLIQRGYSIRCMPLAQVHHKFARSNIRDEKRLPKSLYMITRSRGYYAVRHGVGRLTQNEVIAGCNVFVDEHLRWVESLGNDKLLTKRDVERLSSELKQGMADGISRALSGAPPLLRTPDELSGSRAWKPVAKMMPKTQRLRVCFVSDDLSSEKSGGIGYWTLALARAMAAAGHEVSIVTVGGPHATVDLENGVWIHRVKRQRRHPCRCISGMPSVHSELRDCLFSVHDEVLRINAVRGLDIVSAPLCNVQGLALLADRVLPVVVSLHAPTTATRADRPDRHGDGGMMTVAKELFGAEKWSLAHADLLLADSPASVSEITDFYNVPSNGVPLAIVPRGLDDVVQADTVREVEAAFRSTIQRRRDATTTPVAGPAYRRPRDMNLVVTRLNGGLGNQFFQYAVGRALALRYDATLKLDLSELADDPRRRYELDKYPIRATIATADELMMFGDGPAGRSAGCARLGYTRYCEPHFYFDPAVRGAAPPVQLIGFWQSERYFRHIGDTIRHELTPIEPMDPDNERALANILQSSAIALHIRRGDYVTNPLAAVRHGVPSLSYYRHAMDYIASRVADPVFYVFSDDHDWVRDNLRHPAPLVQITVNGPEHGFRDIRLMSACKHHILANSSFSWWGAWMNTSADKIVIAPTPWFLDKGLDTRDLLPPGWMALPAYDQRADRERSMIQ